MIKVIPVAAQCMRSATLHWKGNVGLDVQAINMYINTFLISEYGI